MELKIDDVAKLTGLTKRTIRYYEEIGLIAPPVRSEGGYRLYTEADVEQIKKVLVAREALGFTLQELLQVLKIDDLIRQYRSNYKSSSDQARKKLELENIAEGLEQEIGMIDQKMKRMEQFKQELADMRGRVQAALKTYEAQTED